MKCRDCHTLCGEACPCPCHPTAVSEARARHYRVAFKWTALTAMTLIVLLGPGTPLAHTLVGVLAGVLLAPALTYPWRKV